MSRPDIPSGLNEDFLDMLVALQEQGAEFLVVGAHALAVHGVPRATGDLDIWVRASRVNAERVLAALQAFGAPIEDHGVTVEDFTRPGTVYQLGLPPRRIDLMTEISGVDFEQAWADRVEVAVEELRIAFLGRETLLRNKRAAHRDKDLADVKVLESAAAKKKP